MSTHRARATRPCADTCTEVMGDIGQEPLGGPHLILDACDAAEGLHLRIRREGVGVALHERGLDARHGQQLRQLIDAKVGHACT